MDLMKLSCESLQSFYDHYYSSSNNGEGKSFLLEYSSKTKFFTILRNNSSSKVTQEKNIVLSSSTKQQQSPQKYSLQSHFLPSMKEEFLPPHPLVPEEVDDEINPIEVALDHFLVKFELLLFTFQRNFHENSHSEEVKEGKESSSDVKSLSLFLSNYFCYSLSGFLLTTGKTSSKQISSDREGTDLLSLKMKYAIGVSLLQKSFPVDILFINSKKHRGLFPLS
jgi:hypothetical protein